MSIAEKPSKSNGKSIDLDNVGPIGHLSIPIPENGGVVVLRGPNGSGKTHALTGVESLYNKTTRKGLRNSDGVPSGTVSGLGVTVRLGRSNTVKGELICESLDGKVDPSQLVDPGLKDPLAADAKRLATLIRLAGIKVSAAQWAEAIGKAGDSIALDALVDDDPVASADKIRRRLHDVALTQERLANSKATEAATLEKSIADIDLDQPHDAKILAELLDEATAQYARALQQEEDATVHNARYDRATLILAEAEGTAANETELAEAGAKLVQHLDEVTREIATLQASLDTAKNLQSQLKLKSQAMIDKWESAKKHNAQLDQWRKVLEGGGAAAPSPESIERLLIAKREAQDELAKGETVRRALATVGKSKSLATEAEAIANGANKLRDLARSTDSVLESALIDAGFDQIKVHDGRLCVESDRGLEPFSELSHGERWVLALDLAARGLPKGAVLPVCQEAFESLDPANRAFVNKLARERGLVIVTAEATGGELRAEIL